MPDIDDIQVRGDDIRLGQLLKLTDIVDSGADVKVLLADGQVTVNGESETRRGRRLVHGDIVESGGRSVRVVAG